MRLSSPMVATELSSQHSSVCSRTWLCTNRVARSWPGRLGSVPYEVRTSVFEGPFDLLLHLITSEQVDVYEVSLSRIVDGYLVELERMDHLDLEVATEFLLIAATLIELKTRRL